MNCGTDQVQETAQEHRQVLCHLCSCLVPPGLPFTLHLAQHGQFSKNESEVKELFNDKQLHHCDKCKFTTTIKNSLKMHKLTHAENCPFCSFQAVKLELLRLHILSAHAVGAEEERKQETIINNINNKRVRFTNMESSIKENNKKFKFMIGFPSTGQEGLGIKDLKEEAQSAGFSYLKVTDSMRLDDKELITAAKRFLGGIPKQRLHKKDGVAKEVADY